MKIDKTLDYLLSHLIEQANAALSEARDNPDADFYEGKNLAYYEVITMVRDTLIAIDADLAAYGLDGDMEKIFFSNGTIRT